jgi:hypothetical protein
MLDLADLVFEDSDPDVRRAPAPAPSDAHVSPLRPWGMWGGSAARREIARHGVVTYKLQNCRHKPPGGSA